MSIKTCIFFFLTLCFIITAIFVDHYCIMANFLKNGKKIRTTSEHYTLKIVKILRTANFTGSYKKRMYPLELALNTFT